MTKQRNDNHSTEFGIWLRQQEAINSKIGFATTNLDYMWSNYKTGEWMLIEEKRYNTPCTYSQKELYKVMHRACKSDDNYKGVHLLVFENTNPEDGKIFWDKKEITKEQLIKILQFEEDVCLIN